ncbi:MAG: hypothetical protein ACI4EG_11400 [Fusicatenibacter sp.]
MVYTSTTDSIVNHKILRHGEAAWAVVREYYPDTALDFAMRTLEGQADAAGYNAIIGIHYSVQEMQEGISAIIMGTFVEVE